MRIPDAPVNRDALLYKVSAPRPDPVFYPSKFWRTDDWTKSSHRPKDGYQEDVVLFASTFEAVSIHLFPRIRRLRVRIYERSSEKLATLGFRWESGCRALILCHESDRETAELFHPTVFMFERDGFEQVPSNEYVSRRPQTAVAWETLSMADAIDRWQLEVRYVSDLDAVISAFHREGLRFSQQK